MLPIDLDIELSKLKTIFSELRDGVAIADGQSKGFPLIYINAAFEQITGYKFADMVGTSCKRLQGPDTNESDVAKIGQALRNDSPILITIKNYRKNGEAFWNELSISPIHDGSGKVKFFVSIQKDVTEKVLFEQDICQTLTDLKQQNEALAKKADTDGLTHLFNRHYFDVQYPVRLRIAARHNIAVSLFFIDADYFKKYNDKYGHVEGDKCLKSIAQATILCFSRATDICARFGGEEFIVLSMGLTETESFECAERLLNGIRDLSIPHSSSEQGLVTVSVGAVYFEKYNVIPDSKQLLKLADDALYQAKNNGRNCAVQISDT